MKIKKIVETTTYRSSVFTIPIWLERPSRSETRPRWERRRCPNLVPETLCDKKDAFATQEPLERTRNWGVSKNRGTQTPPKWMVYKKNGKPLFLMDELGGKNLFFRKHLLVTSCVNEYLLSELDLVGCLENIMGHEAKTTSFRIHIPSFPNKNLEKQKSCKN